MIQSLKNWWDADKYRGWLLVGGFIYAGFISQGIPLWDDDFTSWLWKTKDHSIFHYILETLSPISTQPQYWGFNERPLEALVYKFFSMIGGYESWSYFLFKDLAYAGVGVMIYCWGLRLVPKTQGGRLAALAAAVFALVTPGFTASHVLFQDFAPIAELIFLSVTYFIWSGIEKTPQEWRGFPRFSDPVHRRWLLHWAVLSFCTYLGYKSKADVKMVPVILAAYVFLLRRKQLGFFVFPLALMLLLAIPWGPGVFSKLPPFIPGSKGSEVNWMWQPASLGGLREFLWASAPFELWSWIKSPTISLAGVLGPFLLVPLLGFLAWRMEAIDKVNWTTQAKPLDRARTFALIWFVVILAATSALSQINYIFRIRYGILPMVPASLLLAWAFGLFADSQSRLSVWVTRAAILVFAVQVGINLDRSFNYRRDMGQVIVAVDQAYEHMDHHFSNEKLVLLPDFRPYDYRPDAGSALANKEWLSTQDDLPKKYAPGRTYAISWKPSLWEDFEEVAHFSGCRSGVVFDSLFPCPGGSGTHLMRFIGQDPLYAQGEALRNKGDVVGARKLHEEYLKKYPGSLAGYFVLGLEAYQQRDWQRATQVYSLLENYFPDHLGIVYNHALVLVELGRLPDAIQRFEYVATRDPANYGNLINLYYAYRKSDQIRKAQETLVTMKRAFPNDGEVNRLLASQP